MEKLGNTLGLYWGYMGIVEKKMATIILYSLGMRVLLSVLRFVSCLTANTVNEACFRSFFTGFIKERLPKGQPPIEL